MKTKPRNAVDHLDSPRAIRAYLRAAIERGDPQVICAALDDVAEARGRAVRSPSVGALAIGALAAGSVVLGAFAIGALAIGRISIGRTRIRRLEVGELVVDRLVIRAQDPADTPPP